MESPLRWLTYLHWIWFSGGRWGCRRRKNNSDIPYHWWYSTLDFGNKKSSGTLVWCFWILFPFGSVLKTSCLVGVPSLKRHWGRGMGAWPKGANVWQGRTWAEHWLSLQVLKELPVATCQQFKHEQYLGKFSPLVLKPHEKESRLSIGSWDIIIYWSDLCC